MPKEDQLSELGEAALAYARAGLWVFPVHTPNPGGGCSCRNRECTSVGKHPRTRNGLSDATVDLDRIESWWTMWPNAGIGISCGPSGLVVVDVDPRHGGDESWRDLVQALGPDIENTRIAATGGGGSHYIYRCPNGETVTSWANSPKYIGPLGPGIDLRARGGYIVAPPSIHATGALYEWEDDREPATLPHALLERIHGPRGSAGILAPLESTQDILAGVDDGARDWTLFRFAARLRAVDIPIDMAYALIEDAAAKSRPPFPLAEARKKVDSAYRRYSPGVGAFAEPVEAPKHEGGLQGRVLLGQAILGGIPEPTWVVQDTVPEASVMLIYGEPGSGKTLVDLAWHVDLANNGIHSVFVDEESGETLMGRRLAAMGADPKTIDEYFHYYPFVGIQPADADALVDYVQQVGARLVSFDSLADMLSLAGIEENAAGEVTKWMVAVAVRIARQTNASVVLIDHNAKDTTNVAYSRGSGAKKAKADGAWWVEKTADFDEKKMGKVLFHRKKNRPGFLPEVVHYDAGGKDGRLVIERAQPGANRPSIADPKVLSALEMLDARGESGAPIGDIRAHKQWTEWTARQVMTSLVQLGWATLSGEKRGAFYVITEAGSAAFSAQELLRVSHNEIRGSHNPDSGVLRGGEEERPPVGGSPPSLVKTAQGSNNRKPVKRDWWSFDKDEDED